MAATADGKVGLSRRYRLEGDERMLELRPGAGPVPLWLEHRGQLYRMTIGISEYIERAIEARGLFGWQWLFCDWQDHPHLDLLRRQFEDLQRLFRDVDCHSYLRRCVRL